MIAANKADMVNSRIISDDQIAETEDKFNT